MKYIRTKDGRIYDSFALRVQEIAYKDQNGKWCREWQTINPLERALKIADTIEELCDEFVIVGTNWRQIIDLEDAKYNCDKHDNLKIYGAIWTDKGLIYVAKLKGVLPNGEIDWELL